MTETPPLLVAATALKSGTKKRESKKKLIAKGRRIKGRLSGERRTIRKHSMYWDRVEREGDQKGPEVAMTFISTAWWPVA